jgi:adenylate cyclase
MFIQHGKTDEEHLFVAQGITTNIPILQQSAYSSGSFNTLPDNDGIVRYVPLLFAYDDSIYPSLSFEMVRTLLGEKKVEIFYDENGVSGIKMGDLEIPTDEQGRLFVNFKGGAKSYRYISALDIYDNNFNTKEIEGNIILLGTSASGLLDLRATPFESIYPGVEVHANAIDNLINSDIIASPSYIRGLTVTAIVVSVLVSSLIISFATPLLSFGLIVGFLMLETAYFYNMLFEEHLLPNYAYPLLSTLITTFVLTFMKIFFENRQKMMISEKFSKKVSPQVAAKLLKNSKDAFSAAEVEVTIFFSDIRDFTSISEGFENPKILIDYLNTYMSPMSQIIIDYEGTIDKYIGDAIMAYWNAPLEVKNHADKALSAAIKQIEALDALNETLRKKSYPEIKIGIGLHTGSAIVGEMGSEGRSDYTVIGDAINLGSRIEGLCKPYGTKILISEQTKEQLTKSYKLREVDCVQVKGKEKAVTIYEVLGFGEFKGDELVIHKHYLTAKTLYKKAKFKEAHAEFFKAYTLENCKLFTLYMDRCTKNQEKDIKEISDIHRYTTK